MKTAMSLTLMAAAASAGKVIENEFIVRMHPSKVQGEIAMFRHFESYGIKADDVIGEWNINDGEFVGYAFKGSDNQRMAVMEDASVMSVSPNEEVHALCQEQTQPRGLYGLNRVSNFRNAGLVSRLERTWGQGVKTYILDTGVRYTHQQFTGRTDSNCYSAVAGEQCGTDGNGHGTHVAGTVAGSTYGVAAAATIVDVKVLSRSGSGSFAGVINGVNWTGRDCVGTCTANMSLGGGASRDIDDAVKAAANAGVSMVLASGNSNTNACNSSPARAGGNDSTNVITVNSSDINNRRSSFSNYGVCTDVFAPGSNILSAWYTSDTATNTISGTSMASPHVCGVVTAMLGENKSMTTDALKAELLSTSVDDVIANIGQGSNNRLSQISC